MTRRAWLTPDALPSTLRSCVLRFPDSEEWHAIVRGCLYLLSEERNFEAFGGVSVALTADAFRQTLFSFLEDDCVIIPIGSILEFAGVLLPDGFLWADGTAISRTTYAALYSAIGVAFGVGDGSTTFNLPDRRGRVGVGQNLEIVPELERGDSGGEYEHTLTVAELAAHKHDTRIVAGGTTQRLATNATGNGSFTASADMANAGGGQAHNNMQPYLVLNYIIRY